MKLEVLYFGLVAEAIKCVKEELIVDASISVTQLRELLIGKYKELEQLSYQIAVNQKLASPDTLITNNSEIAILPPFAGG